MIFNKDKNELSLGQFCISKRGRDKGKIYIVYEIVDEDYILLVNGRERKIENPKKKNRRHLQKVNSWIDDFNILKKENKLDDIKIKRFIKLKLQEDKIGK